MTPSPPPPDRFQPAPTPDPASIGDPVTVCFDNPALANQTITIEINDGQVGGKTDSIQITLDADGKGCGTWTVPPGWDATGVAFFTHPTSQAGSVAIV